MTDPVSAAQRQALINLLQKDSLRDLVIWLDIECLKNDFDHFSYQAMARGFVALGYELVEQNGYTQHHPVYTTLKSAENYVLHPSEENWDIMGGDATMSYPFGPGDGCFSLRDSGVAHGQPGDGCSSGAGSLASVGINPERVMELLRDSLIPWLNTL